MRLTTSPTLHYQSKLLFLMTNRPSDSRMWNAMGNCYEKMDRKEEAVKCHERAERFKDKEGIALHKLAQLFISMGESHKAATCFVENLKRKDHE